jgi:DNA-binding NarL/FixJ family response regulator
VRAGAAGYLLKGSGAVEVEHAVRTAAEGGLVFGSAVAGRVAALVAGATAAPGPPPFPELTERERGVLDLLAGGRSNDEIARTLHVSSKTVRNAVSSVYAKLGVPDRASAIVRARDAGLGRA